jgi:hypothetical protein
MAETLKIVIDADVSGAISGVQQLSKVISSDFTAATNAASASAANLSKDISASVAKINSSLEGLKVTSLDVNVNTSGIDAQIKDIQAKFATLVDPTINVLANTTQAETQINDLIAELGSLKGSEIFIQANDSQALAAINAIETELKGVLDKQIKLNVDSIDVTTKIEDLKAQLSSLQDQRITISADGLPKLDAQISEVKNQLDSISKKAVVVPIDVNTNKAIDGVNKFGKSLDGLTTGSIAQLQKAALLLRTQLANLSPAALKSDFGRQLVTTLETVKHELRTLESESTKTAEGLGRLPRSSNQIAASFSSLESILEGSRHGFSGIANGIGPLLEDFERLKVSTGSTGGALNALVSSLMGPAGIGLAVVAVSSLLEVFGDKLFGAAKSLSDAEIEARKFTASIADIKTGIDQFFSNLDFEQGLQKLKNKLKLGDAAEVFNIGLDKQSADKIVKETDEQITKASNEIARIINNKTQFLSKSGQKLAETFFSSLQTGVTVDVSGLNEADTKIFSILNESATRINALQEQNTKARRISAESDVKIELQKAEDIRKALEKQKDAFEKFQNEIIAKAKQFNEEFGNAFIVPDLKESFFKSKDDIFKLALKELQDIKTGNLKIKLPVLTTFDLIPEATGVSQDTIDNFFKGIKAEANIPVEVTPDISLSPGSIEKINKKLDLQAQFKILGSVGLKEFDKIFKGIADTDFTGMNEGIKEATKQLKNMMDVANTLNQAIGQGLVSAFNGVFDAILEGKSVFKALGNAIKELVVGTIKAIAQMLILKAITNLIFPGAGGAFADKFLVSGLVGSANFGGVGGSPFSNVIQIVGQSRLSGNDIVTSYSRATNSSGRFG